MITIGGETPQRVAVCVYLDIWRKYYNKELRVYVKYSKPENGYLGVEIVISLKRVPENLGSN